MGLGNELSGWNGSFFASLAPCLLQTLHSKLWTVNVAASAQWTVTDSVGGTWAFKKKISRPKQDNKQSYFFLFPKTISN